MERPPGLVGSELLDPKLEMLNHANRIKDAQGI